MDLCSRPEFRVQFMFARHQHASAKLKKGQPTISNILRTSTLRASSTRVHHSQMGSRMATWHIVVPFIEKGTLISSGMYLGSDYVPLSVPR